MDNQPRRTDRPGNDRRIPFPIAPLCLLTAFFVAYDACSYFAPANVGLALTLLHAAVLIAIGLIDIRWGTCLLLASVVLADDISRLDPYGGYEGLTNLMTLSVGGVAIGNPVALAMVGIGVFVAFVRWPQRDGPVRFTLADLCMAGVVAAFTLGALHGWRAVTGNPRSALNDLNLPIMTTGLYVLVRLHTGNTRDLMRLWNAIILATAAKSIVWLSFAFLGVGLEFGTTLRVGYDSGSTLFVLLIAYGPLLQQRTYPMRRAERWAALACATAAGGLVLITAGRMNWIFTAYALFTLVAFGRLRDKVRWLMLGGVGIAVMVVLLLQVLPFMFQTLSALAGTLQFWDVNKLAESHSNVVRIYEFKNIHAQLLNHDNLILGDGPGSTFTDKYYPWPDTSTEGDFSYDEILQRKYKNTHSLVSNLILNIGYGGMLAFVACMAGIFLVCLRAYRRARSPALNALALSLLAFLPVMVYMSWSAKTYVLTGTFLGIAGCLGRLGLEDKEGHGNSGKRPGIAHHDVP